MRLEQRIGRVDRIGQTKEVQAINFVVEDSVECRVCDVLEDKLSRILKEFGVDKVSDVLDSSLTGALFEETFTSAIRTPDKINTYIDETVEKIRCEVQHARTAQTLYSNTPPTATAHPLPHWVEQMTINYLQAYGGQATLSPSGWTLVWPDGRKQRHCVFSTQDINSNTTFMSLDDAHMRKLTHTLPAATERLPSVTINTLPGGVTGVWGLLEIRLQVDIKMRRIPTRRRGYITLFIDHAGTLFLPTAQHIWSALQGGAFQLHTPLNEAESAAARQQLLIAAERSGTSCFHRLQQAHLAAVIREKTRGAIAFKRRREAISRVGLQTVHNSGRLAVMRKKPAGITRCN